MMGLSFNVSSSNNDYDVIVIGGGPAGASTAIYTARAKLRTLVIDKGLTAGALGLTHKIANYPGVPGEVSGAELVATMRQQAESFGATFIQDRVLYVNLKQEPKLVVAGTGEYTARAVVVATGAMGRTNSVPGEEAFIGRGVSYCATCDGAFFEGHPVAVAGNNDEAVHEALHVAKYAAKVYFLVQTPQLKVDPHLIDEAEQHPRIEMRYGTRLREISGNGSVEAVRVAARQGGEEVLPVKGAFVYLQGNKPVLDYLKGQVAPPDAECLTVNEYNETLLPGVFAIGDLLCNHVKQAVVAAADGVVAAMGIERYLSGREARPDWS